MRTIDPSAVNVASSEDVQSLARAIVKARRIAFVTGAGVSVQSGIPDFRSATGLFQTLKEKNPKAGLTSGKDLFSANLFQVCRVVLAGWPVE